MNPKIDLGTIDVEKMREALKDAQQRIKDHDAAEKKAQGERVETCAKCGVNIPHGDSYVPVVRNRTTRTVDDPSFIGRQHVYVGVGQEPAGALCLACIGVPRE